MLNEQIKPSYYLIKQTTEAVSYTERRYNNK